MCDRCRILAGLTLLVLALAVGFSFGVWFTATSTVQAQQKPGVEEISPGLTTGSIGVHTLLAHRIAADSIMVQGIDLINLQENMLNLLRVKGIATLPELQDLVENSKAETILRMKPQQEEEKK